MNNDKIVSSASSLSSPGPDPDESIDCMSSPIPDDAIGEILEWLAAVIVNDGKLPVRALAACAYDAIGALVTYGWEVPSLKANMASAKEHADGGVCLPAIDSVVTLPHSTDRE